MTVRVVYDGACPFCRSYVRLARLRERVGTVELIDGREAPGLVRDYAARGYDVDDSILVDVDGTVLRHGAAVAYVNGQVAPRWSGLPFLANPALLAAVYPGLRAARNASLRALGIPKIRPAQEALQPRPDAEEAAIEPVENAPGRPKAT